MLDLRPARVFINIGTNDLSNAQISIDSLIERYDTIITKIEEALSDVEIYLMAYYPINYEAAAENMKACISRKRAIVPYMRMSWHMLKSRSGNNRGLKENA